MEEVIREQVQDENVESVEEITLDSWESSSISAADKSMLELYTSLNVLSMVGCGLTSLVNFPALSKLIKLDLSDNALKDGLDHLKACNELLQLNLCDNQIKTIEDLSPLGQLSNLYCLELLGNDVATTEGYRAKVFELCSSLVVLDGLDEKGSEIPISSEDENSFEGSEDDFSIDSDLEGEDEDLQSDSEEYRPKRTNGGNEPESNPRKYRK